MIFCTTGYEGKGCDALRCRRSQRTDAVCMLGKKVGMTVANEIAGDWPDSGPIEHGRIAHSQVNGKPVVLLSTRWPGWGGQAEVREHLADSFKTLINVR